MTGNGRRRHIRKKYWYCQYPEAVEPVLLSWGTSRVFFLLAATTRELVKASKATRNALPNFVQSLLQKLWLRDLPGLLLWPRICHFGCLLCMHIEQLRKLKIYEGSRGTDICRVCSMTMNMSIRMPLHSLNNCGNDPTSTFLQSRYSTWVTSVRKRRLLGSPSQVQPRNLLGTHGKQTEGRTVIHEYRFILGTFSWFGSQCSVLRSFFMSSLWFASRSRAL